MNTIRKPRSVAFAAPVTENGIVQTLRNLIGSVDIETKRQILLKHDYVMITKNRHSWTVSTNVGSVRIKFRGGYTFSDKREKHRIFAIAASGIKAMKISDANKVVS